MHNDSKEIREAKRDYYRKWRAEHPEQVQAAQDRFWQRKAVQMRNIAGIQNEEGCDQNQTQGKG